MMPMVLAEGCPTEVQVPEGELNEKIAKATRPRLVARLDGHLPYWASGQTHLRGNDARSTD
jgi:hypothetical protein